ncbi:MAG: carbohydrate ABC transporter permease [Sphaerochaetaceae bacterium]|nr:carbohydrate ABC transporter permease [Sphaerochaetaceae bacterium]
MKSNKGLIAMKVFRTILFIALSILFLLPLFWMLSSSLKTSPQVFQSPFRWVTDRLHWENYKEIWTSVDFPFYKLYFNSIFISVFSLVGQVVISSMAAYSFAMIKFKGRNILFIIFLITMMIPTQAVIIPRYVLFREIGIYNTLWSIILPHFFSISSIFLFRQFFMSFPKELQEAATIDGASHLTFWAKILTPLTKNVMISVSVLCFIGTWNEYLNPLIFLANQKLYTVTLGIRYYLTNTAKDYNLMLAAASSAIVPIMILYASAQNYFEEGIAKTGIKG